MWSLPAPQVEKRLAEQDPACGTFVGSTVAQVERFLTVHGQIILNQFRTFPIKGALAGDCVRRWHAIATPVATAWGNLG